MLSKTKSASGGKIFWGILLGIMLIGSISWAIISWSKPESGVAGYSTDDPKAPKIELAEKNFDFGKINLTDVAKHDFKIKNAGQNSLIITNLMTSCHCTTAIFKVSGQLDSPAFDMHQDAGWQGEIAPGQEAVVEAIYEPAKMPVKGQVSRVITFSSNDPANSQVQLEIVAEVE